MKTLLVLGNGFDINCHLDSKFLDFFKNMLEEGMFNGEKVITLKDNYRSNIWYIIFYYAFFGDKDFPYLIDAKPLFPLIVKDSPLWMDVESYIKRVMTSKDKNLAKYISRIGEATYIDIFSIANKEKDNHQYYLSRNHQFHEIANNFVINRQIIKDKTMDEYLFYELQLFEKDFGDYLRNEMIKKVDYKEYAISLLSFLRGTTNERLYILSFNYTWPRIGKSDTLNHVHGDLSNNIIIGYDSSDANSINNPSLTLTKGWQKLFSGTKAIPLPSREEINCIKFYGHSLGDQDYSYFHALFDYYDVYNRDVSLIFYYSEYEDTPEKNELIKANYISKVYKLLDKYVEESEKENKRRTFVSRLLLENRLKIVKISV